MQNNFGYRISDDVVYRVVGSELVLIEVSSGTFFYFSNESRAFFDSFREARSIESLGFGPESQMQAFMDMLIEKKILVPAEVTEENADALGVSTLPKFLRVGTEKLDQVSFLY